MSMYLYVYICIYRRVPSLGTTYDGVGWDVNVHVKLQKQLMLRTRGVGWGEGMGWDVNVHVKLQKQLMLRARGVGWVGGWGGMLTFM